MNRPSRLLVVDDDLAMRLRLRDLLEREGEYELYDAVDGEAALETIRHLAPDLVLLDIMMPGLTGYDVCSTLRTDPRTREMPIIMLSAAGESETMSAALDAGADDFLRKPISGNELRGKVRNITRLNRYRALAAERDRFRWLLDHSMEPLIVTGSNGAILHANRKAQDVFEIEARPGADIATVISRHFRADPPDAWAAWRELRLPPDSAFTVFRPEAAGRPAGYYRVELHAFQDESEQTLFKFTNQSGSVRRELEAFTFQHLISHKIRMPLYDIVPVLGMIETSPRVSMDDEMAGLLKAARESAEQLENTLTRVLDYHAAVFGSADKQPVVSRKRFSQVVAIAAANAGLSGRVHGEGIQGYVMRPEMMEVVLTELFENYAKFSTARTSGLEIELRVAASGVQELTLSAPGRALPVEIIRQLGRPYLHVEDAAAPELSGIGLGLATVRQLLRWHGAELRFAPHPGGGLRTIVLLPRSFIS